MKIKFTFILIMTWFLLISSSAKAISEVGKATMKVLSAVYVEASQPLALTAAALHSSLDRIKPGNEKSAYFKVSGEPHSAFQINLPSEVTLTTQDGLLPNQKIKITNIMASEKIGQLNSSGKQIIYVGASRASLQPDQQIGNYEGTFTLELIY